MLRVLIVDDHAIIRRGLCQILKDEYPSVHIDEAKNAEDATAMTILNEYDVVLCDLSMPGRSGLDIVEHVKHNFPKLPVLILSIHPEEQYAIRALRAGAAGYLSKDAATEELIKAVHRVLQGRKYISASLAEKMATDLGLDNSRPIHESLSNREFDVFKLIAAGKSLSQIAEQLSLSLTTVSTYRARLMLKLDFKTNSEITRYCINNRLIE